MKPPSPSMDALIGYFLLLLLLNFTKASPWGPYLPPDLYLIDCGSPHPTDLNDDRGFQPDHNPSPFLSVKQDISASADSLHITNNPYDSSSLPLYQTARILPEESEYSFPISSPGLHWVRLYFYPVPHPSFDLTTAVFTVSANELLLLENFTAKNESEVVFKEYLINTTTSISKLNLKFSPVGKLSFSFINAIEVASAPNSIISDLASSLNPIGDFNGLSKYSFEVTYRLNVGGAYISPSNDPLFRTWLPDKPYLMFPEGARNISSSLLGQVNYPNQGATPLIAPDGVYSTAVAMVDSQTSQQNFNLSWKMAVDPSFDYLIRMHFCDIISKTLNELYFNVYVEGMVGVSGLDLSSLTGTLATAYYRDFVINASAVSNGSLVVQVGPASGISGSPNAILNGLEVLKMSNPQGNLDGTSTTISGTELYRTANYKIKILAAIVLAVAVIAMVVSGVGLVRARRKRDHDDYKHHYNFSSWLSPLNNSKANLLSSRTSYRSSFLGSYKSNKSSIHSSFFASTGFGKFFAFKELQEATDNFDEKAVIGVGGFGKVYIGAVENGSKKVAIKRGNPKSQQGIHEFQTEIQMLSRVRHRHLVSLVGYCDENTEMILVYEYMSNGPLRDHIYGSTLPPLPWKKRLEICIGAARGLHYLHTGAGQGIIHRDVKTTNVLLDEDLVAKVSDFGLSKAAPELEQTHVSTAVKGSFGYLDPEYFRRQQLSEKSDVYSFGVVLFEVICARPAINSALPREQVSLAEWAMKNHRNGVLEKIMDPNLVGQYRPESIKKYTEAAEKCLAEYGVDRPAMSDVLWNLESALQLETAASQDNNSTAYSEVELQLI